ncbi:MAG: hypothetical protein F9K16_05075 [Thermoanaerobaculia bacterium]|nr:MAG: hypothetical protein F9K16_05075 [Thermoanaerobaculia bacterium]MBZ0102686.1 hypothetical protein [Thermoanaerobaculia bacterium]
MPVSRYSVNAGVLERLDLPTGGRVEWTWDHFQFPEILADRWPCPQELPPEQYFWTGVHGVTERRTYDHLGSQIGTWTYAREAFPPEGSPGVLAEKLVVSVRSPLNDLSEHFFSIYPLEGGAPYCPWEGPPQWQTSLKEYGLPYTREASDPHTADGIDRFLSRKQYDCPATGTLNCVLKRSTYVAYEQDAATSSSWDGGELLDRHRRPYSERTVFHDDGDRWTLRTSSNYDGVGHYRTTVSQGNFPSNAPVRTATTGFNPGLTFPISPSTPWILGTFDSTEVSEVGGATLHKDFGFQASTGLLNCVRTLRSGTTRSATDLLTKFTYQNGNLVTESHYGGDLQPIGTGVGCGAQGTSVPITIQHEWDHGVRARSQYSGATSYLLDLDIDAATGLPTASRDSALVQTDFSYDKLGRTTRIDPQAPPGGGLRDGVTQIVYPAGNPAEVIVRRCDPGVLSCIASVAKSIEEVRFDGLGRVIREKRTRPNPAGGAAKWSKRVTGWDGAGHRTSVSSWVDETASNPPKTTFQDYDPFGRPGRITAPDGSETNFTYQGVRLTTTEQEIDLSQGSDAQTPVERRETFDHRGRRITVEEYSNPAAPATYVQTTYRYDAGDRLDRVRVDSGGTNQDRLFTYDGRGFLLSEQHPEKGGLSGHGTVQYGSYDARGKAGYRRDVGAGGVANREVRFVYDGEERLYRVRDGSNALWKEFTYYTGNTAGASLGKLKTAWRHNDLDVPTNASYDVTETYEYEGRHGRASKRTTQLRVGGVLEETWFFETDYDRFGSPDWISYPCTGASCSGDTPSREIEVTYDQGLMVGIEELGTGADWASSLTWHPNLTLAKVTHGNDLVETIAADANGMARPASITWAQGGTSSGTGNYVFDGAGNVSRMGQDHFQYDQVSRLVFATLGSLGRTQASSFDRYGSLTSLATDGQPAQAIPVRGATNRLLAGGYDASGNLLSWSGNTYAWSPVDTLTSWTNGSEGSSYVYTADDERLLALHWNNGSQTWTVRDFGNRVLRRDERLPPIALDGEGSQLAPCPSGTPSTQVFCDGFESGNAGGWTSTQSGPARTVTDYVWRGAQLLGSQLIGDPWRHYGLDHLGTIRVVAGDIPDGFLAEHTYFPFGREATELGQDAEAMKFTGHERDLQTTPANQNDDLDYLHARFSSPVVGRFLSIDPVGGRPSSPQSWNRYSYVIGQPLNYTDPTGELPASEIAEILARYFEDAKEAVMSTMSDGSFAGALNAAIHGTVIDVAAAQFNFIGDVARMGNETGDAIGSDSGPGGIALAVGRDALRVAAVVAPAVAAGRSASVRVAEVGWTLGDFKSAEKWASQMAKRGWTRRQISEAVRTGERFAAENMVNKGNAATRFIHPQTGRSVVLDDVTKEVLHVGADGFKY